MGRDGIALALLGGSAPQWSVRVELCGVCPGEGDGALAGAAAEEAQTALARLVPGPGNPAEEDPCRFVELALRRFFRRRGEGVPYVEARMGS
jgi:hypothetical protein